MYHIPEVINVNKKILLNTIFFCHVSVLLENIILLFDALSPSRESTLIFYGRINFGVHFYIRLSFF